MFTLLVQFLPSALVSAGLAVGTAGLSVVAIITIHCMHMLVIISITFIIFIFSSRYIQTQVGASQTLGKLHHSPYLDYGEVVNL